MINWLRSDNYRRAKVIGLSIYLIGTPVEMCWYYIYLGHPYP